MTAPDPGKRPPSFREVIASLTPAHKALLIAAAFIAAWYLVQGLVGLATGSASPSPSPTSTSSALGLLSVLAAALPLG